MHNSPEVLKKRLENTKAMFYNTEPSRWPIFQTISNDKLKATGSGCGTVG